MIFDDRFVGVLKMILILGAVCVFAFLFHLFYEGSFNESLLDF